jgi:hypothetical protein
MSNNGVMSSVATLGIDVYGFTQPLTDISTRNIKKIIFLGSKVRLVR